MVSLQDVVNIALIVGIAVSVAANVLQYFYGPWAKRRADQRVLREETLGELQSVKMSVLSGSIPHLTWWDGEGLRLPRRMRNEIQPFVKFTKEYADVYKMAKELVKLAIYESVAHRPSLPRVPKSGEGEPPKWIVKGSSGSRMSRDTLEDALIEVLREPLLAGKETTWGWLKDHQFELAAMLSEVADDEAVIELLEDIVSRTGIDYGPVARQRRMREKILSFRFTHFPAANE